MSEIKRVLVANRGEIALRAIRSIKEMGKEVVVVYSVADRECEYLRYADASICIGPPPSAKSYLHIPAIISSAIISQCDAIFPGYGFLSENRLFVEICRQYGLKFIGPSYETMSLVADKNMAKEFVKKIGVPTIPGSDGVIKNIEDAKEIAKEIGFPFILKAVAGGGGRGMRIINSYDTLESSFNAASSEAKSSFGSSDMYIEKYIRKPRHIEVQIIGDSFGNVIHLGERDCSVQRRHQKLIEESPAVILDDVVRSRLCKTAVKIAKNLEYENAGTIEFLLDENSNFYFMEINTRLQVEHPITEARTNVDIVKLMLKVAQGEKLFRQTDVTFNNHAIECRIVAEDSITFLPNHGKITKWVTPGGINVRLDTHACSNYSVPIYYDSMIAKLIVWDETRPKAIFKMKRALSELTIEGIKTTIDFHKNMMDNIDFIENGIYTNYLSEH